MLHIFGVGKRGHINIHLKHIKWYHTSKTNNRKKSQLYCLNYMKKSTVDLKEGFETIDDKPNT